MHVQRAVEIIRRCRFTFDCIDIIKIKIINIRLLSTSEVLYSYFLCRWCVVPISIADRGEEMTSPRRRTRVGDDGYGGKWYRSARYRRNARPFVTQMGEFFSTEHFPSFGIHNILWCLFLRMYDDAHSPWRRSIMTVCIMYGAAYDRIVHR